MSAKVVRVLSLTNIDGADNIQLAKVLGWNVVVRKDEFKVGDLAVYFSIGSVLDASNPHFTFLEGKRLQTKKIRGELSQGLLLGIDKLSLFSAKEDDDVTEILKVVKYIPKEERDIYNKDENKILFPSFVPKTDEERVQNISNKLYKFENRKVIITQKYDGTSTTFVTLNNNFTICGRNFTLLKNDNSTKHYFEIAERYQLKENLPKLQRDLAIQGEIIGPKINGNRHKVTENEYYVFNIYDINQHRYLTYDEILSVTTALNLKTVKLLYSGIINSSCENHLLKTLSVSSLLDIANSQKYETGQICEGIVLKTDDFDNRLSCKIISNEYLLKYKL